MGQLVQAILEIKSCSHSLQSEIESAKVEKLGRGGGGKGGLKAGGAS